MAVGFPLKTTYANGDVYSASDVNDTNGTINLLQTSTLSRAAGKNAVINGGFDIWQRGTTFTTTGGSAYTADRWWTRTATGGGSVTTSRQATSDTTNLPNIQYCARFQRVAANIDTGALNFANMFESVNSIPFAGQKATLSFYARKGANYSPTSSVLNYDVVSGTGTDQNVLSYTGSVSLGFSVATLTTTWQRFTVTVTVPTNSTELSVLYTMTPTGVAGAADYFEVTGVQLELGSVATTFSRAGGTIQGELAACQRYYYRLDTDQLYSNFAWGFAHSTTAYKGTVALPVTLRVPPSAIDYSTLKLHNVNTAVTAGLTASITASEQNKYLPTVSVTVSSGLTTGNFYYLGANNSTAGYIGFSAEL
jgi:hypothetical protein